jgi:hypothetical protein
MSDHLSEDQISRSLIGRSTIQEEEHLRNCPQCLADLEGFRKTCGLFRDAMKEWTDRLIASGNLPRPATLLKPKPLERWHWRWALVGVALILLSIIPLYKNQHFRQSQTQTEQAVERSIDPHVQSAASKDVLLMDAVIAHRARAIPASMEPVMVLLPADAFVNDTQAKTIQRSKVSGGIR